MINYTLSPVRPTPGEDPPEYLVIEGWLYERQQKYSKKKCPMIEIDDEAVKMVDEIMKTKPGYMNRQEVVRDAIRCAIDKYSSFHPVYDKKYKRKVKCFKDKEKK